jgi:ABC-type transport system substrate-binding protein
MRSTRAEAGARVTVLRLLLLLPILLLALCSGCSQRLPAPLPAAGDADVPRRGGVLHLASYADVTQLDPAGNVNGLAQQAINLLFEGLVDYDAEARIVPALADHWDVSDEGRRYRFVLREGVLLHDGTELTADDVKRSVERALHPSTPNPYASYFAGLVGFRSYVAGKEEHLEGVTVEGRYVVSFLLAEPDATFLHLLALPSARPTCKDAGSRLSDGWRPCGAGPFRLEANGWQHGSSLRLVRHDGYFRRGLPYLDAVEWTYNMQALPQLLRFERGELDIVRDLTDADLARFVADPRWKPLVVRQADTKVYGEAMNTRIPPFDNVEVRRAVAAAIDRDHYHMVLPVRMTPMGQVVPRDVPGFDPTFEGQRHDYAAALEHMKKAGYPFDPATGRGGWPRPIEYLLYDSAIAATAQLLQQDLAKIGLHLELKMVSWSAFLALQGRPDGAAMSMGSWEIDYPDPSSLFEPLFTTASITPESSYNTAFYSNPHLDELLARARREMDPDTRRRLYAEANRVVCDDAPWAFTFGLHYTDFHQGYVRGYRAHPVWSMDLRGVWLDPPGKGSEGASP